jgi:hypothetical protein
MRAGQPTGTLEKATAEGAQPLEDPQRRTLVASESVATGPAPPTTPF